MPSINTNPNYSVCDMGMVLRSKRQVVKPLTADEEAINNLEQELNNRQEDLVQVRQVLAQSMATLKHHERKYAASASQAEAWEKRALLALQMGDKKLAGEALSHQKTHADAASTLKASLAQLPEQVESLKKNLVAIEAKIIEAKNNREIFKARLQSAQTQQDVEQVTSN